MPLQPSCPLLNLQLKSMHLVDTENRKNLHELWSMFSRCAGIIEDGKRLENLSWRIFSREALPTPTSDSHSLTPRNSLSRSNSTDNQVPSLSCSVDSDSESSASRLGSSYGSTRSKKHITPSDLENIFESVKENQRIEPLSPLPPSLTLSTPPAPHPSAQSSLGAIPQSPSQKPPVHSDSPPQPISYPLRLAPESSTSTVATAVDSEYSEMSSRLGTVDSTSTELSGPTPVRGFSKDNISCSRTSGARIEPAPTPILKTSLSRADVPKKKKKTFIIGAYSSGENEESSFESHFQSTRNSSLSAGLRRSKDGKKTSFRDEVNLRMIQQDRKYESEEAIEDSDDDDPSESAIEEDDDEDWEDDVEPQEVMFQRVESKPNLVSRPSLLTTMMHEKDRAAALQNAASRSTPAIRRSRTTSPNGPLGASPPGAGPGPRATLSRAARPIIMTTSNIHEPSELSPRTTRRNMLSTELTGSLRKHLLWERQHKNPANSALLKRQAKSEIRLSQHMPTDKPTVPFFAQTAQQQTERTNSLHNYFDSGLQEYHERGW